MRILDYLLLAPSSPLSSCAVSSRCQKVPEASLSLFSFFRRRWVLKQARCLSHYLQREPARRTTTKAIVPRAGLSSGSRICCRSSVDVDHRPSHTQIVKELVAIIAPNPNILSQNPTKCFSAEGVKLGGVLKNNSKG